MIQERLLPCGEPLELIRGTVAKIIRLELKCQKEMAEDDGDPRAADYDAAVFLDDPEAIDSLGEANQFPCIFVTTDSVRTESKASVNSSTRILALNLDCFETGDYGGGKRAGQTAATKAWRLAGLVRRILESDPYTYLGLPRGIVSGVKITEMKAGEMNVQSASRVCGIRVAAEIMFDQNAPVASGEPFEGGSVLVSNGGGQAVAGILGGE